MTNNNIHLQLRPSYLALMLMIVVVLFFITLSYFFTTLCWYWFMVVALIAIFWLIKYLSFIPYLIDVNLASKKITLSDKNSMQAAQILDFKTVGFCLTVVRLQIAASRVSIPIFIDSTTLIEYKKLRVFLLWY